MLIGGAHALSRQAMNMTPGASAQRRALQDARSTEDLGEIDNNGAATNPTSDAWSKKQDGW
jgi:hypothetical protein